MAENEAAEQPQKEEEQQSEEQQEEHRQPSPTKKKKKRTFRHDIPVAKPFTREEIADREVMWNGSFHVTSRRQERALLPPTGAEGYAEMSTTPRSARKEKTSSSGSEQKPPQRSAAHGSSHFVMEESGEPMTYTPPWCVRPWQTQTSAHGSSGKSTYMSAQPALPTIVAKREEIESIVNKAKELMEMNEARTGGGGASGSSSLANSPSMSSSRGGMGSGRKKPHHLGGSQKLFYEQSWKPSAPFEVSPNRSKFFEGPQGYPVPHAHKIFQASGGTPRSGRRHHHQQERNSHYEGEQEGEQQPQQIEGTKE